MALDALSPDRVVRQVAIVGAGMMGAAIAAANVRRNVPVVLSDADPQTLATVAERIAEELAEPGGPPSPQTADTVGRLVTCTTDDARLGECDLVIESIVESEAAKQRLYARIEPHLGPATILASNTSTIPIGRGMGSGSAVSKYHCGTVLSSTRASGSQSGAGLIVSLNSR